MASKLKKFTVASRDKVAQLLADLPEKPKEERGMQTRELITSLTAEIHAAQAKGYTIEEIVNLFKSGGIDIGMTTFKASVKSPKTQARSQTKQGQVRVKKSRNYQDINPETVNDVNQLSDSAVVSHTANEGDRSIARQHSSVEGAALTPAASKRGTR